MEGNTFSFEISQKPMVLRQFPCVEGASPRVDSVLEQRYDRWTDHLRDKGVEVDIHLGAKKHSSSE